MDNPFQIYKTNPKEEPADPLRLEEDELGNGLTGAVTVPCVCGVGLTRALYEPFHWVHVDDETIVRNGVVIQGSKYNHQPHLNVIEAHVVD